MMNNNNRDVLLKIAEAIKDTTTIEQAVDNWLTDHPEATTTVQDGAITKAKLDEDLQETVDDVPDLKSEIGDFEADVANYTPPTNKFVLDTITPMSVLNSSGTTQSSEETFTTDYIECSPSQVFRLYRLKSDNSFVSNSTVVWIAEYNSSKEYITRNSFKNNFTIGENTHYVRLSMYNTFLTDKIIAVVFDITLTSETIEASNGYFTVKNQGQVDTNSNNIIVLQRKSDTYFGTEYVTKDDFTQGGWASITNYASPNPSTNTIRLRCEKVINSNVPLVIDRTKTGYDFTYACFDSNNDIISGTGTWQSESIYIDSTDIKTFRISIRKSDNSNINVSDFYNSGIYVRERNVFDSLANIPVKLKVMTYNIGRFSYGMSPYYLSEDYNEKLANYKKFFSESNCDLIGLQEQNVYLDGDTSGSVTANSAIFDYLYPYHSDTDNWTCIKSKYALDGVGHSAFTASSRTYSYATLNISGRSIFLMCVHTTPNSGTEQDTLREQEIAEIISIVSSKQYFIVFGDFNAQTTGLYDDFTDEGFHIANGGYLPFEWTYSYNSSDFSAETPSTGIRYFDNIVTSSNIIVDYSERRNAYASLSSDHIPFVAYLTVN